MSVNAAVGPFQRIVDLSAVGEINQIIYLSKDFKSTAGQLSPTDEEIKVFIPRFYFPTRSINISPVELNPGVYPRGDREVIPAEKGIVFLSFEGYKAYYGSDFGNYIDRYWILIKVNVYTGERIGGIYGGPFSGQDEREANGTSGVYKDGFVYLTNHVVVVKIDAENLSVVSTVSIPPRNQNEDWRIDYGAPIRVDNLGNIFLFDMSSSEVYDEENFYYVHKKTNMTFYAVNESPLSLSNIYYDSPASPPYLNLFKHSDWAFAASNGTVAHVDNAETVRTTNGSFSLPQSTTKSSESVFPDGMITGNAQGFFYFRSISESSTFLYKLDSSTLSIIGSIDMTSDFLEMNQPEVQDFASTDKTLFMVVAEVGGNNEAVPYIVSVDSVNFAVNFKRPFPEYSYSRSSFTSKIGILDSGFVSK